MSDQPRTDLPASADQADRELLVADLERRIEQLEGLDDSEIGSFTALDWFLCITGSIAIPAIALWWFAG
ncbi:MAG: hypothetical protein JRE43_04750 [Deltaproteobacteria bacterium]|jgi:hypothetical protein|nr:hypothetical protein [Deltaproteobacteria bacterium]MBW2541535.1 hypothetical protein [Deltaproteobacteria bacterium]